MKITVFSTKEFERPYIKCAKKLQQDAVDIVDFCKEVIVFPADDLSLLLTDGTKYHIDNERLKLTKKT